MESSGNNLVQMAGVVTVEPFTIGGNERILHFSIVAPKASGLMMDCTIYLDTMPMQGTAWLDLLHKGSHIWMKGYLQGSNYTSKSGRKVFKTVLVCEKIRRDERESKPKESAGVRVPYGFHVI